MHCAHAHILNIRACAYYHILKCSCATGGTYGYMRSWGTMYHHILAVEILKLSHEYLSHYVINDSLFISYSNTPS